MALVVLAAGLRAQVRFDPGLVQMDAVVTGRDGTRVAGLGAADFEVLQDGRRQKITHVSYVSTEPAPRRVVVLVDDTYMPLGAQEPVRRAPAQLIAGEVRAGDLVSLVRTSGGSGALRQFTSDRALLDRALDAMRWMPPTRPQTAFPGMALIRELDTVLAELGGFPGRKALVLVAPESRAQLGDVRAVADIANRASVTIHSLEAAPEMLGLLASATGGMTLRRLREAVDDLSGYYLIGWDPGPDAFQERREIAWHRVRIRARDKSLRVRTREGYFARPGMAPAWRASPGPEGLRQGLTSLFHGGDIEVSLSALFAGQEAAGSYVDSLMHIAAQGVRFEQDDTGCWNARLEIARAFWPVAPWSPPNDRMNTQVLDVHACGESAERLRREGLVTVVRDRVPSPGAYQVRAAVRNADAAVGALGSAARFLAIPDLRRSGLAISGITLWSGEAPPEPAGDVTYRPARGGDPALRQFRGGEEVRYSFRVFGAAGAPDLRMRLLRDGREVRATAGVPATGVVPLAGLPPGDYVLGVSVAGGGKSPDKAEQWIDFVVR